MAAETTYASVAEIDTFAIDNGKTHWSSLTNDQKLSYALDATNDLVAYHKQLNDDGTLWTGDDTLTPDLLKKACIYQALYIAKIKPARDVADKIRTIGDNYKDSNVQVENPGDPNELDGAARRFVTAAIDVEGVIRATTVGRPRPQYHNQGLQTQADQDRAIP